MPPHLYFKLGGGHRQFGAGIEEALAPARRISEDEQPDECGAGERAVSAKVIWN